MFCEMTTESTFQVINQIKCFFMVKFSSAHLSHIVLEVHVVNLICDVTVDQPTHLCFHVSMTTRPMLWQPKCAHVG